MAVWILVETIPAAVLICTESEMGDGDLKSLQELLEHQHTDSV